MQSNSYYDNIQDRKEIYHILEQYLSESDRKSFLEWCCRQVNTPLSQVLRPGRDSCWHPKEVYWQIMSLSFMHHLSLDLAYGELIQRARGKSINVKAAEVIYPKNL